MSGEIPSMPLGAAKRKQGDQAAIRDRWVILPSSQKMISFWLKCWASIEFRATELMRPDFRAWDQTHTQLFPQKLADMKPGIAWNLVSRWRSVGKDYEESFRVKYQIYPCLKQYDLPSDGPDVTTRKIRATFFRVNRKEWSWSMHIMTCEWDFDTTDSLN